MTYAAEGNKNTAIRINNAYADFAEALISFAGITKAEAEKVTVLYLKNKIAKLDAVNGTINVRHGAFFAPDVIRRAAAH